MKPKISIWRRMYDLISPRLCAVCGRRLSPSEESICVVCCLHLPRTYFHKNPYENEMNRLFWHQIPIERATALIYYEPHAETAQMVYDLKYHDHPEIGYTMGRLMAREAMDSGFFEGIDLIVPIPLATKRLRQRGYNQSKQLAEGISSITHIPIDNNVVRRISFEGSQTKKGRWERAENVEKVFQLNDCADINGRHVLLVDDIVTTGATIIACAKQLASAGEVKVSVIALGYSKS